MKQEKKRIRSVWKYHFEDVKICCETDVIFTRCRVCKELKPSNLEYFRKDTNKNAQRMIQPLCNECAREMEREQRQYEKQRKAESEPITAEQVKAVCEELKHVEQKELFDENVFWIRVKEETLESKINKIFNFLWLK